MPARRFRALVDQVFNSASELELLLASIGFTAHAVQLEGGQLVGRFQFLSNHHSAVLRLGSNLRISVGCPRNPALIPISLEIDGQEGVAAAHGQPIEANAVAGTSLDLTHSFFQFWPEADVLIALLPKQALLDQLNTCGGSHCVRLMQSCNQLLLHHEIHQALVRQLLQWLADPASMPLDPIASIIQFFNDETVSAGVRYRRITRYQLVFNLIALGASGAADHLDLDQLADRLNCSRRSLIQGCKELLGLGPKELLRIQRLEKVHQALLRHDPKIAVESRTVNAVAEQFGFHSRGHFAAAYRRQFGQLPTASLRQRA